MKGLTPEAQQHVVVTPQHIRLMAKTRHNGGKLLKMAETLKMLDGEHALCYNLAEFEREFSTNKGYVSYMKKKLAELGVKRPKVVKDEGKIYIMCSKEL